VRLYQDRAFGLCLRFLEEREEARDATQETFLRAWRWRRSYRPASPFPAWLAAIAANLCRDRLRHRGRWGEEPLEAAEEPSDPGGGGPAGQQPDRPLEQAELGVMLRKAIGALAAEFRMAVILRELEGLSYEEIARAMDCSVGTVRSRLFRARQALRELLGPYRDEGGT
jgi:RNA polymerase sigma-70 factor (ECF subfamily)